MSKSEFYQTIADKYDNYDSIKCCNGSGHGSYNLPVEQIHSVSHEAVQEFYLTSKNTISQYPFGGTSSSQYLDFNLEQIPYTYHQFVLKFTLTNTGTSVIKYLLSPLIIDKIQILKDGNTLGFDTVDWDVLLYNLNKFNTEYNSEDYGSLYIYNNAPLTTYWQASGGAYTSLVELPIPLNRSYFLSSSIKNNLVIRIYFKNSVVLSGADSDLKLSDVNLILRVRENSNKIKNHLINQPRLDHLFSKKLLNKYTLSSLNSGQQYNIKLNGFNHVASLALIFLTYPSNNVNLNATENNLWCNPVFKIDQVYITDGSGVNINNNNKNNISYNKYLLQDTFKGLNRSLRKLSYSGDYNGEIFLLNFSGESSDAYNQPFTGGYSFKEGSDYTLNFTSLMSSNKSLELNILWFIPAVLSLNNGDLSETIG